MKYNEWNNWIYYDEIKCDVLWYDILYQKNLNYIEIEYNKYDKIYRKI